MVEILFKRIERENVQLKEKRILINDANKFLKTELQNRREMAFLSRNLLIAFMFPKR